MSGKDLGWLVEELRALAGELNASAAVEAPLLLAIDQGGHASRVVVFDLQGAQVAQSFATISTLRSGADRIEHDAQEVVESIRAVLDDVREALGEDANRVVAAGLATQRSSIVCWDRHSGRALSPVLSWQDRRNAALVERLREREAVIREQTGLVLSAHYGASKIRWCLDELAAVREARDQERLAAGPIAAYLLHALLIERPFYVDPANASRTQLWSTATRDWSATLLAAFDIPPQILPRCVPSRHAFGTLDFGGRRIPLSVCTGDQSAMPFALGAVADNTAYVNIGTGAFVQSTLLPGQGEDLRLLRSVLWSDEQRAVYIQEGTINGAGAAIDWLNERVGIDTHRAALAMTRRDVAQSMPPLFINSVAGVGSPYWRAQADPHFVGAGSEHAQVVAVVESIAFLIGVNLQRMRGKNDGRVLVSGGLSSSDYLCECIATLSGCTVERTSLREATATGLAFLTAGEPATWQPIQQSTSFLPIDDESLKQRYLQWLQVMASDMAEL
jgi:glycerol kinase